MADIPSHVELQFNRATAVYLTAVKALIAGYPEHARTFAFGVLGAALGVCDCTGASAEAFIGRLRAQQRAQRERLT